MFKYLVIRQNVQLKKIELFIYHKIQSTTQAQRTITIFFNAIFWQNVFFCYDAMSFEKGFDFKMTTEFN